ncbi:hypothetical protein PHISP_02583 [Aspergillus sp. HF37]|nr:hypothetical protein PHISP_02583 [Aspergillus sp. HF37]
MAAPAPAARMSMMASSSAEWTMEDMKRVCNDADTSCTWTFGIDDGSGSGSAPSNTTTTTPCTYIVEAANGIPASRADGGPSQCGEYTITSGWSGQFGEEKGFTTLSVVNDETPRQIIWPAYTDKQLEGGQVVKPDQSYAPATLPL